MTSKEHYKHARLAKPSFGNYARNEWAILGSTCETIQQLASIIIGGLSDGYKAAYLDATHKIEGEDHRSPALVEYTSHPSKEVFQFNSKKSAFAFKQQFNEADVALVNGNHLAAKAQVVIIDDSKKSSLQKRIPALTDVQLILMKEEKGEIYDFIKEAIPAWRDVPVLALHDAENIITFFRNKLKDTQPPLNALVLAGGKSMRMGYDKTSIQWHGQEQRYYMADLLRPFVHEVFISCRAEQESGIDGRYHALPDSFADLGPYGAILSAFRSHPDAAWLVIASDLPLLDAATIRQLVDNRRSSAIATTFMGSDEQPEPLITIWEPKSYLILLTQLSQGHSCPRKLLINNDTHIIPANNTAALMNVNTPEQAAEAKRLLEQPLTRV